MISAVRSAAVSARIAFGSNGSVGTRVVRRRPSAAPAAAIPAPMAMVRRRLIERRSVGACGDPRRSPPGATDLRWLTVPARASGALLYRAHETHRRTFPGPHGPGREVSLPHQPSLSEED